MVYTESSCSTVLVVEDVVCTVEPLLGTAVTVYPVTGGLLSGSVGGVHVTVMDKPEVAMVVRLAGGGGAGWGRERGEHSCWKDREQQTTYDTLICGK